MSYSSLSSFASEGGENLCPTLHQKKGVMAKHLFSTLYRHFEKSKSMKFAIHIVIQNYRACGGCACRSWFPWGSEIKDMIDTNPIQGVQTQEDSPVLFFLSKHDHNSKNLFQKMK